MERSKTEALLEDTRRLIEVKAAQEKMKADAEKKALEEEVKRLKTVVFIYEG
jgi:hypothetical protein